LGGACSTYGEEERCIQSFDEEPEGKNHLEDPGVGGRIFMKWDGER